MIRRLLTICMVILSVSARAQESKPEDILTNWSARSPIEKVYLHTDRDNYLAGETAWFTAYLYSDYQPDTISTSLYVDLLHEVSGVIHRKVLPVFLGVTTGQLELPDSLVTGSYVIRGYTPTMLNQDAQFIFKRSIFVFGKKNVAAAPKEKLIRMEFFPEGGNLVTGLLNTFAFKATNENGMPVDIKGSLKNEKNEILATFNSYHDGMGMFELTPGAGEKYYVVLDGDLSATKYYLPASTDKGIAVTVMPHPQGNFFEIKQNDKDPDLVAAYMIGQMQHHVVFRQNFSAGKAEVQGVINTLGLMSGILQITFFNKKGMPLAERLCFVDNKEYRQPAEIIADSIDFSKKARNRFSISLKDTIQGSLSVSVTDPVYSLLETREDHMISHFLLSSDLRGYIHHPAYYFSADNDSVKTALDLVMMTNGWRRFRWTDLVSKSAAPLSNYKDGAYITLKGRVNIRDTKKPFAEKELLLLMIAADSSRSMQMVRTNKEGEFKLDSLVFYGNTRIMISDIRGKKNQYIDVLLSSDSLNRAFVLPVTDAGSSHPRNSEVIAAKTKAWEMDYDDIAKASGLMLDAVVVKIKRKSPVQELEEKYASGLFSGMSERTIDLVNTEEVVYHNNIFDYLQLKVPGLTIANEGLDYSIYYRQTASASSMGLIPMTLYLNEIETDASFISTIPASQIAMVKIYSSFAGAVGNAPGGVLAVYTKKGSDMEDVTSSAADLLRYRGYSLVKEFYAPDYKVDKAAAGKTDHRITLDWRPNIFVNNVNPKIPVTFYNNDRTKSYRVIVEGMTISGKLIYAEKIIAPVQKAF